MTDIWHVKLENGDVRSLTLDELDAGYKDGWIRGRTPVLASGAIKWSPLRDVAGLDPSGPWEAMPASIAPQAIDIDFGADLASSEIPAELRPKKRGAKIFGVLIAVAVIGGIGFAATRAKPGLVASAKSFVTSHIPGKSAPAKVEAPKPVDPPKAAAVAPPPAPSPEPQAAAPVATMNVGALPAATPGKKAKGGKRR